jgi:hypothetical protein
VADESPNGTIANMDDSAAYAKRLEDRYLKEAPAPPSGLPVPDVFGYLHFKAFVFLTVGPDGYRLIDAFHLPPEHLPASRLDAIRRGCEQIVRWHGVSPHQPLQDIGVSGFYALLRLFHFQTVRQEALATDLPGVVLDKMHMKHVVDGREITLYNKVTTTLPGEKTDAGPPCPYCGEPLRTKFAKQCRHCGMDWHDPENAVCRKASSSE